MGRGFAGAVAVVLVGLTAAAGWAAASHAPSCGGVAPLVAECSNGYQCLACVNWSHGFEFPRCATEAAPTGCFVGTVQSHLVGSQATRILSCMVVALRSEVVKDCSSSGGVPEEGFVEQRCFAFPADDDVPRPSVGEWRCFFGR